jgi:hypothetical protein
MRCRTCGVAVQGIRLYPLSEEKSKKLFAGFPSARPKPEQVESVRRSRERMKAGELFFPMFCEACLVP